MLLFKNYKKFNSKKTETISKNINFCLYFFAGNTNDYVRQELRAVVSNRNQSNNMCNSGSIAPNVLPTNPSTLGTKRPQTNLGNIIVSTCQSSNMSSPQPANTNSQLSPNPNNMGGFNFDIVQNGMFS